jgi:hypothetical protein
MLRTTIVCLLIGGAATGCASFGSHPLARNYCLTDSGEDCSQLEGSGDCQPCPMTVAKASVSNAGTPVDHSRKQ